MTGKGLSLNQQTEQQVKLGNTKQKTGMGCIPWNIPWNISLWNEGLHSVKEIRNLVEKIGKIIFSEGGSFLRARSHPTH